jgi:predicted nucleic-acid-binding protein
MKGIDTNVLLRYLVEDDADQARRAARFLLEECTVEDPGLVNRVVLCELVWVLHSGYGYSRVEVVHALDAIMSAAQLNVEDRHEAAEAVDAYRNGADFADGLIAAVNRRLGCEHTVTFDRKASRRPGFIAL